MGKFRMNRDEKPAVRERPIMGQQAPSGPKVSPTAQGAPKQADQLKPDPDGVNPKQQIY